MDWAEQRRTLALQHAVRLSQSNPHLLLNNKDRPRLTIKTRSRSKLNLFNQYHVFGMRKDLVQLQQGGS